MMTIDWVFETYFKFGLFHWGLIYIIFKVSIRKCENFNKTNRVDSEQRGIFETGYQTVSYFALIHVCFKILSPFTKIAVVILIINIDKWNFVSKIVLPKAVFFRLQIAFIIFSLWVILVWSGTNKNGTPCIMNSANFFLNERATFF